MIIFKKIKNNRNKIALLNRIDKIEKIISSKNILKVSSLLYKIRDMIDDEKLILSEEQLKGIDSEFEYIEKYSSKMYEELLKNRCYAIIEIINKNRNNFFMNNITSENEEKIYRILYEQKELTDQINILTEQMDDALGKDKSLWLLLNMKRNMLYTKMTILSKNYNTMLAAQSNLIINEEIKKAKEEAEVISSQSCIIDKVEIDNNAHIVNNINNEIIDTSNNINETFVKNFQINNDDYLYEKALEEKINNKKIEGNLTERGM